MSDTNPEPEGKFYGFDYTPPLLDDAHEGSSSEENMGRELLRDVQEDTQSSDSAVGDLILDPVPEIEMGLEGDWVEIKPLSEEMRELLGTDEYGDPLDSPPAE